MQVFIAIISNSDRQVCLADKSRKKLYNKLRNSFIFDIKNSIMVSSYFADDSEYYNSSYCDDVSLEGFVYVNMSDGLKMKLPVKIDLYCKEI